HAGLEANVRLLNSDVGLLAARTIPADPTGEMLHLLDGLTAGPHPETFDGVWMSPDHTRALLMVQTLAPGFALNDQEQAIGHIEAALARARADVAAATGARLLESGPPVFAVQTRTHMKQDVSRLSSIAVVLISAILLVAYRSARVLVLSLLPVL